MPNLGGFEVVGELPIDVLNQILQGAWASNINPHSTNVVAGTMFGPYAVADGVVDIPRSGVHLVMDTGINGVKVTLASEIQVHIANPPIPGARFFDMQADVEVRVPIAVLIHVAALLGSIPRGNVSAHLTSGDPVPGLTLTAIKELVNAKYVDRTIPNHVSQNGVTFLAFTADPWVDIDDDASKPTHRIVVSQPTPAQVKLLIPVHLKLSNMSSGLSPAGVVAKLSILAGLGRCTWLDHRQAVDRDNRPGGICPRPRERCGGVTTPSWRVSLSRSGPGRRDVRVIDAIADSVEVDTSFLKQKSICSRKTTQPHSSSSISWSMNMYTRQGRLHPLILLGLFAFAPTFASAAVPAFPGAQGAGAASVGGRGGHVIEVTNLNDSGPGSFRDAVSQTGPRTVVFRVGGTITLQSAVFIREPYLTIAGQTAPGGGIQFRGHSISITDGAHDIIVRYIRSRRGWQGRGGTDDKGFEVVSYSRTVYNVIVDHSSFGWQQDDNSIWNKVRNVTYQWNIFAEANNPDAFNGRGGTRGGKGLLLGAPPRLGQELGTISLHHNYIASNFMRNPAITGDGPTEVVNNVIYNWGAFGSEIQNRGAGTKVNFIGNYYKKGPDTNSRYEVLVTAGRSDVKEELPQMIYTRDNFGPHRTSSAQAEWAIVGYYGSGSAPAPTSFQRSTPWPSSGYPITVSPAQANVENVLNNVGATLPARDAVDARLVAEYRAGAGSLGGDNRWPVLAAGTPPADTDHDGMPDQWETAKGLNRNSAADRNADAGSGYTNLEVYLAGAASGTTPPPPPPPPPPTTSLPDVVVTSLSYASGIFTSTVKNQGTVATPTGPTVGVAYYVDGVARASGFVNGPLAAGASVTIGTTSAPYTIPNGTHTIMAFVDDVNRFAESDETNNQLASDVLKEDGV